MTDRGLFTEVLSTSDETKPGPCLVLTHGFTQNGRCWGGFAEALAATRPVTVVDAPGHGHSQCDEADLWRAGELIVEASPPGRPNVHVGYSMGGRMALHAALASPEAVAALVLIGATAGIVDPGARAERHHADCALADRLENQGLETFLDQWLQQPLFAGLPEAATARSERLRNRPEGLAASLRNCGTGSQEPLWDRLGELTVPVLLIVGAADTKFSELADQLHNAMPSDRCQVARLPGGHAVHLQEPILTAQTVNDWLDAQGFSPR